MKICIFIWLNDMSRDSGFILMDPLTAGALACGLKLLRSGAGAFFICLISRMGLLSVNMQRTLWLKY